MNAMELAVLRAAKRCAEELQRGRVSDEKLVEINSTLEWADAVLNRIGVTNEKKKKI